MAADEQLSVLISLVDEISKPLGEISEKVRSFATGVGEASGTASTALAAVGSAAAIGVAIEGVKKLAEAGIEAQTSIADLGIAVRAVGKDFDQWKGQIESTVKGIREATQFNDDDIRRGLTNLIQLTGDVEQSERALAAAADMASARHTTLAAAAEALGRGLEGVGRGLRAYNIILTEHEQKMLKVMDVTDRLDYLNGRIESAYGGAATNLDTVAKQWDHLKSSVQEFMETAGRPVADWLTHFLAGMNAWIDDFGKIGTYLDTVGQRLGYMSKDTGIGSLAGFGRNASGGYGASGSWNLDVPPDAAAALAMMHAELASMKPDEWKSELDKLIESLNEVEKNWKDAQEAGMSFDAFVQVNASHLQELAQKAGMGGVNIDALQQSILRAADALRQIPQKTSLDELLKSKAFEGTWPGHQMSLFGAIDSATGELTPQAQKALDASFEHGMALIDAENEQIAQKWLQAQLKVAHQVGEYYQQNVIAPFADAFADLAMTGGQNLGQVFSQVLANGAKQAGANLLDAIRGVATGGGPITTSGGYFYYGGRQYSTQADAQIAQNQNNSQFNAYANAAYSLAGFSYQASQGMTPIQGAMSGASAGLAVGGAIGGAEAGSMAGPIGALIGAFVGALIAALTESMPTITTYAVPVISNGVGKLVDMAGEILTDPAQQSAWIHKINDTFDQFRNGYAEIFLSLPEDLKANVLPLLSKSLHDLATNGLHTVAFPSPYADPRNPSDKFINAQDWESAMNTWINTSMPTAMMESFKPALDQMFTSIGLTQDKFNEIWAKAEGMDPRIALQYLSDYASVVGTLHDLMTKIAQPVNVSGGGGLYSDLATRGNRSYADQLRDTDKQILSLGQNLQFLTGQSQIEAAKQLNQLIQQRYDQEKQMVQEIVNMVKGARETLASDIFGLQLQGKTPQQQYALYQTHLTQLEGQLDRAPNAQAANQIYQQIRSTILSMAGLFPNSAAINTWAQNELSTVFNDFSDIMNRFGQQIDAANNDFQNSMQPIIDTMTTTVNQFGIDMTNASTSASAVDAAFTSAATSVLSFRDAIDSVTSVLNASGYVTATRTRRQAA